MNSPVAWHDCYLVLTLALIAGLVVLFAVALVYGELLFGPGGRRLRGQVRVSAILWGVGFVIGTLLLSRAEMPSALVIFVGPDVAMALLLGLLVGGALLLWRTIAALAQAHTAQAQVTGEAGRDKALERQIRALVREQRALNRRQQAQAQSGEKPPSKPR